MRELLVMSTDASKRVGLGLLLAAAIVIGAGLDKTALAASPGQPGVAVGKSGLPVPRFVSLKAERVNVRVGPGEDYKIAWVFTRSGHPIEVIQEYDNWRRVRDSDGSVGWVFQSLLSGKRTAVVAPWTRGDPLPLKSAASAASQTAAYLEPGVSADVERCHQGWCRISGKGFDGWIEQGQLWGVYPDEEVD